MKMQMRKNLMMVAMPMILFALSSTVASASPVVVSGPTDTQDATVAAFNNGTNYGATGNLELQNFQTSTRGWGLLRFDLPTLAPNEYISDATITVQYFANFNSNAGTINVNLNSVLHSWDESQVTWDSRSTGQRWEVGSGNIGWQDGSDPPANYDDTSLGTVDLVVGAFGLKVFQSAALTAVLDDMAQGNIANNGFLLNPVGGSTVNNRFYLVSSDRVSNDPNDNFLPQLELTISTIPEPASVGLLAIGGLMILSRRRA